MKKINLLVILLIISVPVFGLGPLKIGAYGGFWSPTNSLYKGPALLGGSLSFDFFKFLAVEIVSFSNNFDVTSSEAGLSKGRIKRFPILFGLKGQYPLLDGKLTPYVTVGAGIGKPKFEIDPSVPTPWNKIGISIQESIENKTMFHFGIGVEYRVIKMLAFGLDVRYLSSKSRGTWSQTDTKSGETLSGDLGELDFGGIVLGMTIKIII